MTAIQAIPFDTMADGSTSLGAYAGRVLLVVNVASKCGLTPQYEGLEALYERYRDQGLDVLGFPANDFMGQEPGTNDEILEFCRLTYSVEFPVFAKIAVTGENRHPLYTELTQTIPNAKGDPEVLWNFEKFLIARDGTAVARFAPTVTPDDPALISAIEAELAR